jgi:CheY-like chemotaxis protein
VDLSIEPVSCAGVLSESAKMIEPFADKYGIRLEIGEAGGLTMQADAIRVKQVLVNLLSNAIKYNRPGGSVAVACSRRDNTIRISVTDTGEGIPEQKIGELFTQFNRLGRDSGDIEGTGIGLAHSKRLVELMDGSIGVESVYGTGSTFWIEVPASEETGDGGGSPFGAGSRGEDLGESEDTRKQITVLYIEDNPAAVRLMEQMLITRARYRLVTAHSGSLGVDIAEVEHPEVMLVDINLPGIDGYEVLRRVRESEWGREIPVIAVSANAMDHAVKRGENAGFTEYVTKPFDIANFLATLDEVTAGLLEG